VPKVNVYLPDDLAEEVRAAKLSLSPVCQRAIRKELDEVKIRRAATTDLAAVAERLNATIDGEDAVSYQEGREDGIEWAREHATASELRWLVTKFEPGSGSDFQGDHSLIAFESAKHGKNVISVRHEEGNPYWHGFIDGAREVLNAVEPLLNG
jgi:post-segregation antitoxin (ccd killing protein)